MSRLNSVEHMYYFPQQKIIRTGGWFQVSKRFVILECNICYFKTRRFMNIFLYVLNFPYCFGLKVFSFECVHRFSFINNPFLTLAPKIVEAFLKNHPKNLFSNCLVDGLLTSFCLNLQTF